MKKIILLIFTLCLINSSAKAEKNNSELFLAVAIDAPHSLGTSALFAQYTFPQKVGVYAGHWFSPDGDNSALGTEYYVKYKRLRMGLGSAYLFKLGPINGTHLNFSITSTYDIDENWRLFYRHFSHGSYLGIEKNKENSGWNLIGVLYKFKAL